MAKKEKKQFVIAFEKKIKHSYIDKLRLYNNQKVIIKDLKKIKQNLKVLLRKLDLKRHLYLFLLKGLL